MHKSLEQSLRSSYEISPNDWAEIRQEEEKGFVLVHAEDSLTELGKRTGIVDVTGQCALGNVEKVEVFDTEAICRETQESVELTLYFVEKIQLEEAMRQREARVRKIFGEI